MTFQGARAAVEAYEWRPMRRRMRAASPATATGPLSQATCFQEPWRPTAAAAAAAAAPAAAAAAAASSTWAASMTMCA
jgi:hypothetical protein